MLCLCCACHIKDPVLCTSLRDKHNYSLSIHELGPLEKESTGVPFVKSVTSKWQTFRVFLRLTLHSRGCFHAYISYRNQPINNGEFDIIVLSENERNNVERHVSTSGVSIYFEAYLYNAASCTSMPWHLQPMHTSSAQRRPSTAMEEEDEDSPSECYTPETVKKLKNVHCYVSPKQFSEKEFYLKIISWHLYTFQLCPGTKFSYLSPDPVHKLLTLVVDDGIQPPVELISKERNISAATFIRSLHKNTGGSKTFQTR